MLKKLIRKFGPNPLDHILKKTERCESVLIFWNRGLGDIALGIYAIVHRIRETFPDAKITFLTRAGLKDGFALLEDVEVIVDPKLKRGDKAPFIDPSKYDLILDNPDPTHWVQWQLGTLTPKLKWNDEWNDLWQRFDLSGEYIGVHMQTETDYATWRNWPLESWKALFEKLDERILLFGFEPTPAIEGVVDLRGKTTLFELLSIIKNCCHTLIVPDSGVSSMAYFLDTPHSLHHITLWAETNMGILKQNVASPNPHLIHTPLVGADGNIQNITLKEVYGAVCARRQFR